MYESCMQAASDPRWIVHLVLETVGVSDTAVEIQC